MVEGLTGGNEMGESGQTVEGLGKEREVKGVKKITINGGGLSSRENPEEKMGD